MCTLLTPTRTNLLPFRGKTGRGAKQFHSGCVPCSCTPCTHAHTRTSPSQEGCAVCAGATTATDTMAATEMVPGAPCTTVVCSVVCKEEGELTAAELLMSDANFKEWDADYTGRGWARHYVNRC
eukprot:Rhum_TRINITY_DN1253_c0_g1::Rhum_TRINITY_DN1253_c0_g1_i1::g.3742::m.3742